MINAFLFLNLCISILEFKWKSMTALCKLKAKFMYFYIRI